MDVVGMCDEQTLIAYESLFVDVFKHTVCSRLRLIGGNSSHFVCLGTYIRHRNVAVLVWIEQPTLSYKSAVCSEIENDGNKMKEFWKQSIPDFST